MPFTKFPDIEGLHNVVKTYEVYPHVFPETLTYRAKPKLHGTNAGVRIENGAIIAQSRSRDLALDDDHAGFAAWVSTHPFFKGLPDMTIFGEWCGPGIMKKTAINLIPEKVFAIFMIQFGGSSDETSTVITDPDEIINAIMGDPDYRPANIHVLPWAGPEITVSFGDRETLQAAADVANTMVAGMEEVDPWVKGVFGVEGIGEGYVFYPLGVDSRMRISTFMFKAKGLKHKVVATREAVVIDPEVAASIEEFVALFVTPARLEQGLEAVGGADVRKTGEFLAWFNTDVLKESEDELEAADLDWKQVGKAVSNAAREWYIAQAKAI